MGIKARTVITVPSRGAISVDRNYPDASSFSWKFLPWPRSHTHPCDISSAGRAINRCQGQSSCGRQKGDEAVTLTGVEITNSPYPSGHPKSPTIICQGLSYIHTYKHGFTSHSLLFLHECWVWERALSLRVQMGLINSDLIWLNT